MATNQQSKEHNTDALTHRIKILHIMSFSRYRQIMKISVTIITFSKLFYLLLTLRDRKNGGLYLISIMIDFSVGKKVRGRGGPDSELIDCMFI